MYKHKLIMKFQKHLKSILALLAIFCLGCFLFRPALATGSATLALSPSSGSYTVGNNITFTVIENSGSTGINTVEADFTYNSSQLQYVSSSISSAFTSLPVNQNPSAGVVSLVGFKTSSTLTGQQTVGTVTFKILAAGSTNLSFITQSGAMGCAIMAPSGDGNSTSNVWNGNTNAATLTLSNPSTGTNTGGTGGTNTTPTTTTTTTTSRPSTSTSTPTTSQTTTTSPATNPSTTPTVAGQSSEGKMIAIKVVDANNKPIVGVKVTLDNGQTTVTDTAGVASFLSVTPGKHTAKAVINGKEVSQIIDVKGVSTSNLQQYSIKPVAKTANKYVIYGVVAIAVIAGILIIVMILRNIRKPNDHHFDGAPINFSNPPVQPVTQNPPSAQPLNMQQNIGTVVSPSAIPGQAQNMSSKDTLQGS